MIQLNCTVNMGVNSITWNYDCLCFGVNSATYSSCDKSNLPLSISFDFMSEVHVVRNLCIEKSISNSFRLAAIFMITHQQKVLTLNISFPDQSTRRLHLYCEESSDNTSYTLQVAGEDNYCTVYSGLQVT